MANNHAWVDVRNAFVEYERRTSVLERLAGKIPVPRSVLAGFSMQLHRGDTVTLFGQTGSGKTTALRMLAGAIVPSKGIVHVGGQLISDGGHNAAGYVSSEESELAGDTVSEALYAFGKTHRIENLPARIGAMAQELPMNDIMNMPMDTLSTTQRLTMNLAKAALSHAPVILLDDTADQLGVNAVRQAVSSILQDRTVIVATRFPQTAEALGFPLLLLHNKALAHVGLCDDIARDIGCPVVVDVWVEALRYDTLRKLRGHPGVKSVELKTTDGFDGQRLRVVVRSSRYLPGMYDVIMQASPVKIEELPASLTDVLARL